jgi:acetolactate synthase-1/2/3 large subunit
MILLVGQIARDTTDREAFQEVDYRAMFGPIAKWATQIDDPRRVPEYMARAFRVATSGRPGPVVVALPEDMLTEVVTVDDARPYAATHAALSNNSLSALKAEIKMAERPLLMLGGSGWSDDSSAAITRFAEANHIPVTTSFRRQDIVDNLSPIFAGDFGTSTAPTLYAHQRDADLLVVIGARLGEITTKTYTSITSPNPQTRLVHIYPDADEIGRVYSPDLGVAAAPASVAAGLDGVVLGRGDAWQVWCKRLHDDYLADSEAPNGSDWQLDMGVALTQLRESLPDDAVVTLDAGNHTGWAQRFLRFGRPGRIIGSTCGAMGYSVPAAVAASIANPGRMALSFVGDGGFMMSGNELATAAQYGGRPIILLFNNGIYGTIRMHQERDHPERVSGTTLKNQDFVKMAEGLGAHAERVTKTADFAAAFTRARDSGRPSLIELVTDPNQISTRTTIGKLRDSARQKANA